MFPHRIRGLPEFFEESEDTNPGMLPGIRTAAYARRRERHTHDNRESTS
jgi:hypothetical protein